MLRERPELFYPAYYTAPQHFSPQQASSYSSVQHQVSSQQCYASGYVKSLKSIHYMTLYINNYSDHEGVAHIAHPSVIANLYAKFTL